MSDTPTNPNMDRIKCTSVTDTLMKAMERADSMDGVLVLFYKRSDTDQEIGCSFSSDDMRADSTLWLLEQYKAWLLGLARRED
ncbi:MAG TPA: hypothetical protein VN861_03055 [Candidatus Acidoferrales bacterium]|nr:hypothetical protein [Candidatus Acidoferrales bacterium]